MLALATTARVFTLAAWLCRIVFGIWLFDLFGARSLVVALGALAAVAGLRTAAVMSIQAGHVGWGVLAGLAAVGGAAAVVAWAIAEHDRPAVAGLVIASEIAAWTAGWLAGDARRVGGRSVVVA